MPRADERNIDVAILDMNCGLPNVGHDAVVGLVHDIADSLQGELAERDLHVRAISYAIRDRLMVPKHDGRHQLYLGTGGPGHLDPRQNTENRGEAGIAEDPSWEAPLWKLFDDINADEQAALFGVCHTFGLLCRWSGIAEPALRGPEKGGKMSGVGTNVLTAAALEHPWFGRLAGESPTHENVPVLDSRYYDLIPTAAFPKNATPIAFEANDDGRAGDALTMVELARDERRHKPRIFAVNSHPEIGAAERVTVILDDMLARGTITPEVYEARKAILPMLRDDRSTERLRVARYVFSDLAKQQVQHIVQAA